MVRLVRPAIAIYIIASPLIDFLRRVILLLDCFEVHEITVLDEPIHQE